MRELDALLCLATCASSNFSHRVEPDRNDHLFHQWRTGIPNCQTPYHEDWGCCCHETLLCVDEDQNGTSLNCPCSGRTPTDVHDCAEEKPRIASRFHHPDRKLDYWPRGECLVWGVQRCASCRLEPLHRCAGRANPSEGKYPRLRFGRSHRDGNQSLASNRRCKARRYFCDKWIGWCLSQISTGSSGTRSEASAIRSLPRGRGYTDCQIRPA